MNKLVKSIVSLAGLISIVFGVYFYVDKTYARDSKLCLVELRLDQKIQSDQLNTSQSRLWRLEDRFGSDPDKVQDPVIKQEMKEIKTQIEQQKQELQKFQKMNK